MSTTARSKSKPPAFGSDLPETAPAFRRNVSLNFDDHVRTQEAKQLTPSVFPPPACCSAQLFKSLPLHHAATESINQVINHVILILKNAVRLFKK